MSRFRMVLLLTTIAVCGTMFSATAIAEAQRQFYTEWKYERIKERFVAEYHFKSSPQDREYKKQTVVHYPDPQRNKFIYFFNNEKQKFWGRCASRHHPNYDGNVMVWNFSKDAPPGKSWGPLTKGDPAIPKSNDGATMVIPPLVPDPPFN